MDSDQHGTKPLPVFYGACQAGSKVIGTCGVAVSVIGNDAVFSVLQGDEMGAQLTAFMPVVEEDADITATGDIVKF